MEESVVGSPGAGFFTRTAIGTIDRIGDKERFVFLLVKEHWLKYFTTDSSYDNFINAAERLPSIRKT